MDKDKTMDIVGLREQILDNVKVAFPRLYEGPHDPKIIDFEIIISSVLHDYTAAVLWGSDDKLFVEGAECETLQAAYESLLQTTAFLLTRLMKAGKLECVEGQGHGDTVGFGGFCMMLPVKSTNGY